MKRELMIRTRTLRARGTMPPPVEAVPELERPAAYTAPAPVVASSRPRAAYEATLPTSRLITIG